ncbi:PRKR-interacting protein 1 homolog isoform X1 [Rhagoletis pomonella]|uniref:PRKR-interacting protein 1 homolog isoform X1 n=1 Tax=Rhagoletis pomonella TaxID=28610 RepID=UPI00177FAC9B|nr:PRKR-interacting protein 1 homolog isoform X1 [Rhagoletis pomonella]
MNPEKLSNSSKIRQNVKTATDLQRMKLEKLMMNPVCCREVGFVFPKFNYVKFSPLFRTLSKLNALLFGKNKPVIVPTLQKEKDYNQTVPNFVRNVMGSSAGAGSGEFHVYRHLRRKEYSRQKNMQTMSIKEHHDNEFQKKIEHNRQVAEAKTAKKRAKRLKKKQRNRIKRNETGKFEKDDHHLLNN